MLEGLPITIVDLIAVGAVFLFAVLASFWGFMGLVTGIGAWVGAAGASIYFYPQAQELARSYIETDLFADLAAGIGLFAGSLILLLVLSAVLSHMVKESALGSINRALGFVSGIALGYIGLCIFLIGGILIFTEEKMPESIAEARLYPIVRAGGVALLATVPDELKTDGLTTLEQTKEQVDEIQRAKDLYDTLNNPKPQSGTNNSGESKREATENSSLPSKEQGYSSEANQELESLINDSGQ